jgi:hypothetical protein
MDYYELFAKEALKVLNDQPPDMIRQHNRNFKTWEEVGKETLKRIRRLIKDSF